MAKAQKIQIDIDEIAASCESIAKDDKAPLYIFTTLNTELSNSSLLSSIEATEDIITSVTELKRIEELKKKLLQLEASLKDKITDFMSLHQTLTKGPYTLATYKNQTRQQFDTAGFKAGCPDLYGLFQKEVSIRVFRLG